MCFKSLWNTSKGLFVDLHVEQLKNDDGNSSRGCLAKMIAHLGKFSEESIQNYTRQILEGLQYLHDHHVLHRDIKSANILVNCYG